MCVGNDDDVASVATGEDGALGAMAPGSVLVDHTTASADLARQLAVSAAERGVGFVDAPVSGGQAGAENGAAHGDVRRRPGALRRGRADRRRLRACVSPARRARRRPADEDGQPDLHRRPGAGAQRGRRLRPGGRARHRRRCSTSSARARRSRGRWTTAPRTMAGGEFEFGFAVEWMRKDLAICLAEARRNGAKLPVAALVDQFYAAGRGARRPALGHLQPRARCCSQRGCRRPRQRRPIESADREVEARHASDRDAIAPRRGSSVTSIEPKRRISEPIATSASSLASEAPRQ